MHKGKVDVRGTPLEITNKYGIGYRITISNLESPVQKDEIVEKLKSKDENMEVDLRDFNSKSRITVTLSSHSNSMLAEVVATLELEQQKNKKIDF